MLTLPLDPVFYDFEASRILDGFPIEVGWAYVDHDAMAVVAQGHLIRPAPEWEIAERWDDTAQALHGISHRTLVEHGVRSERVAARMNAVLAGRSLFSDSPVDEHWLSLLFEAANLKPAFEVRRNDAGILVSKLSHQLELSKAQFKTAFNAARQQCPLTHRAQSDAAFWAHLWLALLKAAC
jgi:hypothetical protein